jgi:glutamine synthetase adenylyltransferase
VINELVKLFSTSVFLSNTLLERPEGLDMLLSKELALAYRTRTEMFDEVFGAIKAHTDYEEKLDALRKVQPGDIQDRDQRHTRRPAFAHICPDNISGRGVP